ncbi:mechanosensitive ion channel family protein [Chthonobacter rhizosphaerae]|uniref:mechanosensitive ion channel family protein n=1 Tax=Chthonobacter rhizosphaerae TaxID=2735553 RepID=UPI001FE66361|nr:mechanosensitive ion channel family protein [Chthonobacter rhizosphaerae]
MPTDAPSQLDAYTAMVWTWAVAFLPRLALALIILVVGLMLAAWIGRIVQRILGGTHMDPTVRPVVAAVVRYAVIILVVVAALGQVGVQTASLLAVLGAAGLAIGLALQGTLTNIAAGIMLLWLRPFRIGDYVEVANGQWAGIVEDVGLFVCELKTFDGIYVFVPNSAIWNMPLRNHSRNAGRLLSLQISLPAGADPDRARDALDRVAAARPAIRQDPPPVAFLDQVTADAVVLTWRLWASHAGYGDLQRDLVDAVRRELAASGDETLRPREVVRTVPPASDPSRFITERSLGTRQPETGAHAGLSAKPAS